MVANDLVERRIRDGRTFINTLYKHGFDVTVSFWARTSEDDVWLLYVASPKVDERKLADAYREVYGVLQTIQGTTVSASDVKLIGEA